jgi:hypothetical protein
MQSGIIAAIEDMADRTKKYREILGSLRASVKDSVKNTMKQIRCFDRNPTKAAPDYFFWNTKQLVNDPCTHTGSNCLACKGNGNYGAVYGNTNLTKDGAPKPKPKRTNRKSAKSMGRGNVLGRVCYGMGVIETVSEQDVIDMIQEGEAPLLERWGGAQNRKGQQTGYKAGAAKVLKMNQAQRVKEGLQVKYGRRVSGRGMSDMHMLGCNTVSQAKAAAVARIASESAGTKRRPNRSGLWGRDVDNADKVFAELDARWEFL